MWLLRSQREEKCVWPHSNSAAFVLSEAVIGSEILLAAFTKTITFIHHFHQ